MQENMIEKITEYLKNLSFEEKKRGGVDEKDVKKKIEILNKMYQAAWEQEMHKVKERIKEIENSSVSAHEEKIFGKAAESDYAEKLQLMAEAIFQMKKEHKTAMEQLKKDRDYTMETARLQAEEMLKSSKSEALQLMKHAQEKVNKILAEAQREREITITEAKERINRLEQEKNREFTKHKKAQDEIYSRLREVNKMLQDFFSKEDPLKLTLLRNIS